MISEEDIEKAVDYLRDNATKAAKAKADRVYLEEYRKVVEAQLMREHSDLAVNAQEREAKADPRYKQHLEVMKDAIERDEYHRWMMKAADAKIEVWRTQSSNQRSIGKLG